MNTRNIYLIFGLTFTNIKFTLFDLNKGQRKIWARKQYRT